jgi:peptidoglycan/xylan/chitin deacetylase (PgdA/CDA1 family)
MNARASLPRHGRLHLTFDDGPDPMWTPRLLDVLDQVGAKATFFVIGSQARRRPELTRRIARAGHAIGNHTMTHAHPWTMGSTRAIAEVRNGAIAIADVLGALPKYFRPPHGAKRRCMIEAAQEEGEALVDGAERRRGLLGVYSVFVTAPSC